MISFKISQLVRDRDVDVLPICLSNGSRVALKGAKKESYHANRTLISVNMTDPIVSNGFALVRCIKVSDRGPLTTRNNC